MAQVSRHPLSKLIYERIFEIFIKSIISIKNKKEAEDFLNDFLTPTERIMLAKRLTIAVLLTKGYDYNQIHKVLHVSTATIAGVNVFLKYTGEGYKK
jgi:TrpR-related protein YerC/YecD